MTDQTPNNPIAQRFMRSVGRGVTALRGTIGNSPTSTGASTNPFMVQEPQAMNPEDATAALHARTPSTPEYVHRVMIQSRLGTESQVMLFPIFTVTYMTSDMGFLFVVSEIKCDLFA